MKDFCTVLRRDLQYTIVLPAIQQSSHGDKDKQNMTLQSLYKKATEKSNSGSF